MGATVRLLSAMSLYSHDGGRTHKEFAKQLTVHDSANMTWLGKTWLRNSNAWLNTWLMWLMQEGDQDPRQSVYQWHCFIPSFVVILELIMSLGVSTNSRTFRLFLSARYCINLTTLQSCCREAGVDRSWYSDEIADSILLVERGEIHSGEK